MENFGQGHITRSGEAVRGPLSQGAEPLSEASNFAGVCSLDPGRGRAGLPLTPQEETARAGSCLCLHPGLHLVGWLQLAWEVRFSLGLSLVIGLSPWGAAGPEPAGESGRERKRSPGLESEWRVRGQQCPGPWQWGAAEGGPGPALPGRSNLCFVCGLNCVFPLKY